MRKKKFAFVASGGGIKTVAHLGVLKACEEFGIEFDILVGSSSGAPVVSYYAQGVSIEEMVDSLKPLWKRRFLIHSFSPLTLIGMPSISLLARGLYSFSGITDTNKIEKILRKTLPQNDFRKLEKELYIPATDIDSTERIVFGEKRYRDIPISQAIAATMAVPGIFRPYYIRGRYYVDGEFKRTVSADVAIEHGADIVIVSLLYSPVTSQPISKSMAEKGALPLLQQAINILFYEKALRGIELYAYKYPKKHIILIEPDVGELSFFRPGNYETLFQRGYKKARQELTRLVRLNKQLKLRRKH